jgi:NAD(P)H-dependent flavin oxidoreductase YrpB (nitropropane dioxygenase family)
VEAYGVAGNRFTQLVGCRLPLQQAGMGGVGTPALARAVADAGGLGMLSGVLGPVEPMDGAVGVNFLMPFVDRGLVEAAGDWARVVEFFYGPPDPALVDLVKGVAAWQVGSADEARAALDAGCGLVVAQGVEAGGHVRGTVGLLPLLDEVLGAVGAEVPVVAAGGIGTAASVKAALAAGADAVRVGTRFVASAESAAHPQYVEALTAASAHDTVLTTAFSQGWPDAPHRVLASCRPEGGGEGEGAVLPPLAGTPGSRADISRMALYAGQSVGAVRGVQAAAEIVEELVGWLAQSRSATND